MPRPWGEAAPRALGRAGGQFTALFEWFGFDLLRECAVQGAADLLRITRDEVWGIKARAVTRGLARRAAEVVAHLGVDEKAIAKRHEYLTVVADLHRSRVLYLADDRKQESLDGFWSILTPAQREGIAAVAMDMWEPYLASTRAHVEEADTKVVFDKFHLEKHVHEAVDKVRKAERRTLHQAKDDPADGDEVPLAHAAQGHEPGSTADLPGPETQRAGRGPGLDPQGALPAALGTPTWGRPRSSSPAGSGGPPTVG